MNTLKSFQTIFSKICFLNGELLVCLKRLRKILWEDIGTSLLFCLHNIVRQLPLLRYC